MRYLVFLFFFIYINTGFGQNLVPNGSFEDTVSCPSNLSQISKAKEWYSIRETPDYFNSCSNSYMSSVPSNLFGNAQPSSGNAYAGIGCFWYGSLNYPECIGTQLIDTLKIGFKYYISFKVRLAQKANSNNWCAINKLGLYFSVISYDSINNVSLCNCAQIYSDSIITDTLSWHTIRASFVADSNYKFVGIGRFFTENQTSTLQITGTVCNSYYYIDDVCVSLDSIYAYNFPLLESTSKLVYNNSISYYPNPISDKLSLHNLNSNFAQTIFIFNVLGVLIKEQLSIKQPTVIIDFNDLPNGIYNIIVVQNSIPLLNRIICKQ